MFLADLPGFKNPHFFNFIKKFFFGPPLHGWLQLTQFCLSINALWSQNGSFETPQSYQFLNQSVFVPIPILTCGHESWVMTERILT